MDQSYKFYNSYKKSFLNVFILVVKYSSLGLLCVQHTNTTAHRAFCYFVMLVSICYCLPRRSDVPVGFVCACVRV
jgi:hypothetical protein